MKEDQIPKIKKKEWFGSNWESHSVNCARLSVLKKRQEKVNK